VISSADVAIQPFRPPRTPRRQRPAYLAGSLPA
jgi:hypothetical protein